MDYIYTSKEIEEKRVFSTIEMNSDSEDKTDDDAWPLNVCYYCKLEKNTHNEILKHLRKSSPCRRMYDGEEDILPHYVQK